MWGAQVALGMIRGRRLTLDTSQAQGLSAGFAMQQTTGRMDMRDAAEGAEEMVQPRGGIGGTPPRPQDLSRQPTVNKQHATRMSSAIANISTRGLRGERSAYIEMIGGGYQRRDRNPDWNASDIRPRPIQPYRPDLGQPIRVDRNMRPKYMDRLMADQTMLQLL